MSNNSHGKMTVISQGDVIFRNGAYAKKVNYKEASGMYLTGQDFINLRDIVNNVTWKNVHLTAMLSTIYDESNDPRGFKIFTEYKNGDRMQFRFKVLLGRSDGSLVSISDLKTQTHNTNKSLAIVAWYAREFIGQVGYMPFTAGESLNRRREITLNIPSDKVIVDAYCSTTGFVSKIEGNKITIDGGAPSKTDTYNGREPTVNLKDLAGYNIERTSHNGMVVDREYTFPMHTSNAALLNQDPEKSQTLTSAPRGIPNGSYAATGVMHLTPTVWTAWQSSRCYRITPCDGSVHTQTVLCSSNPTHPSCQHHEHDYNEQQCIVPSNVVPQIIERWEGQKFVHEECKNITKTTSHCGGVRECKVKTRVGSYYISSTIYVPHYKYSGFVILANKK